MRTIISLILVLTVSCPLVVRGQEGLRFACGFNFANGVPLASPTMLFIDNAPYRPAGYKPGAVTQGGMLYEGSYTALAENAGIRSNLLQFKAEKTSSPILAAYLHEEETVSKETKKSVRLISIPNRPNTSKTVFWAFVLDEKRSLSINANGTNLQLPPLTMVQVGVYGNLLLDFKQPNDSVFERRFSPDTAGNYVLFFFYGNAEWRFSFLLDEIISSQRDKEDF